MPFSDDYQVTPVTYLVLILLVGVWPLTSFFFLEAQLGLVEEITAPLKEIYLPTIAFQLAVLLVVMLALRMERSGLDAVGLGRFSRWALIQAVFFFLGANVVLSILQLLIAAGSPDSFREISLCCREQAMRNSFG